MTLNQDWKINYKTKNIRWTGNTINAGETTIHELYDWLKTQLRSEDEEALKMIEHLEKRWFKNKGDKEIIKLLKSEDPETIDLGKAIYNKRNYKKVS